MFHYNKNQNTGYALLFAILVSSILLSAGLGISNIIYKELLLSSIGKQSTLAFYASVTGAECALYWEYHSVDNGFNRSIFASPASPTLTGPNRANCSDINIMDTRNTTLTDPAWQVIPITGTQTLTKFRLNLDKNGCAVMTVSKGSGSTFIDSRGFNTCSGASDRRVERALRYKVPSRP